jgi:hypothetical protein
VVGDAGRIASSLEVLGPVEVTSPDDGAAA